MTLRSNLIRLASEHPEFRKDLLPLIAKSAGREKSAKVTEQAVVKKIKGGEFGGWDAGLAFPKIAHQKLQGPPDEVKVLKLDATDEETEANVEMTWVIKNVDGTGGADARITLTYPFYWDAETFPG